MVFATVCALTATARALERDVTLRFLPSPSSDVMGYRAYVTDEATQIDDVLDVGFVEPEPDGIARTVVVLDADHSFLVGMTAYNAEAESELSNVIQIPPETPICDPTLCDDDRTCTIDSCDAAGCLHTPLPDGSTCDDRYVDTVDDRCVAGVCQGTLLVCREDLDCDDGNVCNGLETCGEIACFQGIRLDCGTPAACATPYCDPRTGCGMAPAEDGTACDDGLDATTGDICLAGVCQGASEAPLLSVDTVSPQAVGTGRHTLTIRGLGFERGATLRFENGKGRAPRVRSLRLLDSQTLEADVEIAWKRRKRSQFWDVVVILSDKTQARLRDGLQVDP